MSQDYTVKVRVNGNEVVIGENGWLKKISASDLGGMRKNICFVDLIVSSTSQDVIGTVVDGNKQIFLKKNATRNPDSKYWKLRVPVEKNEPGSLIPYATKYTSNNLRLIQLGAKGKTSITEVAAIAQNNQIYLTEQIVYDFTCYQQKDKVRCPEFEKKWPELATLLGNLWQTRIAELPGIEDYKPSNKPTIPELKQNEGYVIYYNEASQHGELRIQGMRVLVRPHGIVPNGRSPIALCQGEIVKYRKLAPLTNSVNFHFEADYVEVKKEK